jgi:cytidine deaminase
VIGEAQQDLFKAALAAQANSHAPYSHFPVGAAVRTASGRIFAGANVENVSYPEGICAEAAAIGAMVTAGERVIVEVLTIADGELVTTCCGGCRQRLAEFAGPDTPVHAAGPDGIRRTFTLAELLPAAFGPDHLA